MQEINDLAEVLLTKAKALHHKKFTQGAHELLSFSSRLCKYGLLPSCLEDVQESDTPKQFEEQKDGLYFLLNLGGWRGGVSHVDSKHHSQQSAFSWYMDRDYIKRTEHDPITGKVKVIKLHQVILEKKLGRPIKRGHEVHHLDFDRYNNREENLVEILKDQNARIRGRHSDNISGYLGVSRNKSKKNGWTAEICRHGVRVSKRFPTAESAAQWYLKMAQTYLETGTISQ